MFVNIRETKEYDLYALADELDAEARKYAKQNGEDIEEYTSKDYADIWKSTRGYGLDGIIVEDNEFGGTSYVAFDGNQIKSVDNVGTFSKKTNQTLFQDDVSTEPEEWPVFRETNAEEFIALHEKSKRPEFLTPYTAEEMKGWKHFITDDGVGFTITDKDDIIGVINNSGKKGAGEHAVIEAIAKGGKTLDCVGGHLRDYYEAFGFVERKRVPWDDQYAPKGWNYEKYGKPDIYFFKYPEGLSRDREDIRRRFEAARRGEYIGGSPGSSEFGNTQHQPPDSGLRGGLDTAEPSSPNRGTGTSERNVNSSFSNTNNNSKTLFQPAYHGSPHRFDRFDSSHMGSGEGAQVYGWGHYFASNKEVSEWYRKKLTEKTADFYIDGEKIDIDREEEIPMQEFYFLAANGKLTEELINERELEQIKRTKKSYSYSISSRQQKQEKLKETKQFFNKVRELLGKKIERISVTGQLYEVDIPEDSEMLDWDKELSGQRLLR